MWVRPTQAPSDEVQVFYLGTRAAKSQVGAVLGERYELLELLGVGGTAAVYRALDKRTKAKVAVKVLHAGARETIGAFFQQEGRLTARISSPHLVRAHDFGEDDGRLFIVFDVVPGESLASLFYGRVMPWRELCLVVLHVVDALAALHRLGIVHRDVKPDNVYVARKLGGEPHATLLDLGFALVPPERRMTISPAPSRMVFGTEGYIAPELLGGLPPEPRNDLYSVGALMYAMLTAQQVPDISACPEEMVIPSPRAFLPTIPRAIDDLVMRSLSDVEARFQNAAEMAAAIRAAIVAADDVAGSSIAEPAAMELPTPTALVSTSTAEPVAAELPGASAQVGVGRAIELPRASTPTGDVAELPSVSEPAGDGGPSATELPAGPVAASVGDAGPIAAELSADPAAASSTAETARPPGAGLAVRKDGRARLAAACVAAGLVGAGMMYMVTLVARPPEPQVGAPAMASADGPVTPTATLAAVAEVDRPSPFPSSYAGELRGPAVAEGERAGSPPDTGKRHDQADGHVEDGRSTAGEAAIPARVTSQSAETTPPRRTRMKRAEQTFEQVMTRLMPRARACAQKAGIAETPQSVRVRGDAETGEVQSVRVVNMSLEHPFARCMAEVIREARPPLQTKGNAFTFFSGGGSQ